MHIHSTYLSIHPSIHPSLHPFLHPSVHLFILSIRISIHPSINPSFIRTLILDGWLEGGDGCLEGVRVSGGGVPTLLCTCIVAPTCQGKACKSCLLLMHGIFEGEGGDGHCWIVLGVGLNSSMDLDHLILSILCKISVYVQNSQAERRRN